MLRLSSKLHTSCFVTNIASSQKLEIVCSCNCHLQHRAFSKFNSISGATNTQPVLNVARSAFYSQCFLSKSKLLTVAEACWKEQRVTVTSTSPLRTLPSLHEFELHTKDGATDFISTLDLKQRNVLLEQLQKDDRKRRRQAAAEETDVKKPSVKMLRQMFAFEAVPFVGFGFLDNVIMILCGDYIDMKFGAMLGISTLAAAGFGNLVSDIAGLGTAGYVEAIGARMGLHMPAFTPEQIEMSSVRWASFWGRTLGVTIGCLLGMFPLLFIKTRQDKDEEEEGESMSEEDAARLLVRVKST